MHLENRQPVTIQHTAALETAQQFYQNANDDLRADMDSTMLRVLTNR